MKILNFTIMLLTIFCHVSCQTQQELESSDICKKLGWYEELEVEFHLSSTPPPEFKIYIDGKQMQKTCIDSTPCIQQLNIFNNTMQVKILFREDFQPNTIDISLKEIQGVITEITRVEQFNIPLNWLPVNYPTGRPSCGVLDRTNVDLTE